MKVPKKNDYLARQKARDRVPQDATQRTISAPFERRYDWMPEIQYGKKPR